MLRFFYNPSFKYTNRQIITLDNETSYRDIDYINIDSPDTINGHIIYTLNHGENIPTYILDLDTNKRWFVSGITQLRTSKFQISLIRDIVSEGLAWANEQAYISAGTATDFNKYKKWGLPFTNTKIKEERLNFGGRSSFFVFYVNDQTVNSGALTENDLEIRMSQIPGITGFDYEVESLDDIPYFNYVNGGMLKYFPTIKGDIRLNFGTKSNNALIDDYDDRNTMSFIYENGSFEKSTNEYAHAKNRLTLTPNSLSSFNNNVNNLKTNTGTILGEFLTNYGNNLPGTNVAGAIISSLDKYANKIILNTSNNKVYRINGTQNTIVHNDGLDNNTTSPVLAAMRNLSWAYTPQFKQYGTWLYFKSVEQQRTYTLEELGTAESFGFTFSASQRKLPKSAVRCVNIVADDIATDWDIATSLMLAQLNPTNALGESTATTGRIVDIQYLPFSLATEPNENFQINNHNLMARYLDNDDFSYQVNLPDLTNINKETDTIKIVSPSRGSQFIFSPYNNNGNMEFSVDITVKPYASVLYVRPSTKGLLLADWNDKDCLIIQEDFSLTTVTSAWTEYVYQNKNFQNSFNRTMQGREFERDWQRRVEEAQKKADDWTSRNISSQKAQTYTGNLPLISQISGAMGAIFQDQTYMQMAQLDREMNESLYQESVSLARDQFQFQMENIQSQPAIPNSITSIDIKFLDGIYLEYYSTNESEKNAIDNYYKYNGNRIDAYGTFNSFWGTFVRGRIIISNNYSQPELNELNRRLELGIFTEQLT